MRGHALARSALAVTMSLAFLVGLPAAGMAQEEWIETSGDVRQEGQTRSAIQDRRFDMRDDPAFYVSPVTTQNPWNTCWAFGATAAAESSIFADTGKKVDLSERHLIWFSYTPITAEDDASQQGEGFLPIDPSKGANYKYYGAYSSDVLATYASGAGPALERDCPYRGRKGLTELDWMTQNKNDWKEEKRKEVFGGKTQKEIDEILKDEEEDSIASFLEAAYNNMLKDLRASSNSDNHFSAHDDWSVDATTKRNLSAGFLLKDFNIMPPAYKTDPDEDGPLLDRFGQPQLDMDVISAVKEELRRGHGVAVSYSSASPAGKGEPPTYMRARTYAQYTWKHEKNNHSVCIVGWDDNYAVSNFNEGTVTKKLEDGDTVTYSRTPPGPGAWIVKNSWGKKGGTGTDTTGTQRLGDVDWGVDGSGYFYLSYYDQSVYEFVSYSFIEDMHPGKTVSHQYDYLHGEKQYTVEGEARLSGANVFQASQDETLTSVATRMRNDTFDARVTYAVYRLNANAKTPTDGTLLQTINCLYAYPGYHREQLDQPIALKKGEHFSVVVTQTFTNNEDRTTYVVPASSAPTLEAAKKDKDERFYGVAVKNRGESWIYEDGHWQDWIDYLQEDEEYDPKKSVVDNLTIKAFALAAEAGSYRWTDGQGQTWRQGTPVGLSFALTRTEQAQDTAGHVTDVLVDGRVLDSDEFDVTRSQGGATVTLTRDVLQTLPAGEHRLKVLLDDAGALEVSFTVEGRQSEPEPTPSGRTDGTTPGPLPYGYGYEQPYSYGSYIGVSGGLAGTYVAGTTSGTSGSAVTPGTSGTSGTSASSPVRRLAGANRYQTMAAVVADAFGSSETCVVASGASFADALSATGLAGALKAPVVLTDPGALSPEAADTISRLGCRRALIMGGEAALSPAVEAALSALGVSVERVAGADRASTSAQAMLRARSEGSTSDTVVVASGQGFADALSAGPWAWAKSAPVLLCGADGLLGADALAALSSDGNVRRVVVLGGATAVGDVASQLPQGIACERVGGADRYETSRLVAERAATEGLTLAAPYVASGAGFADALAAGPVAGAKGSALLLADPAGTSLAQTLRAHRGEVRSVTVVGGEAAVGPAALEALRGALS